MKNIINIDPEKGDNMGETGNKEPGGDIAIVDKEETPSQAEIKEAEDKENNDNEEP